MKKFFSFLLVAVVALGLASCSNGPKSVVEDFEKACISGDFDKAVAYTNLNEDQQKMVSGIMSSMYTKTIENDPESAVVDFKVLNVTEEGDTATVEVEQTFKNGTTKTDTHKVVKVDGEWKIDAGK